MSEDYIPLRNLFSESLLRDFLLFFFLFLLVLSQLWDNIILLLFPLISFAFSMYFNLLHVNKWRTQFDDNHVIYNPFGSEKKHANRLFFCALFQLILLFWIGAESLYHPQLIDNYAFFFVLIFIFLYSFGYYWIFIDLGRYTKIEIIIHGIDLQEIENEKISLKNIENIISFLRLKKFKKISLISFLVFILINLINIITSFITITLNIPIGQIYLNLPGTGIENSQPISLSYFIFAVYILPPVITILSLRSVYQEINSINIEKLNSILSSSPRDIRIKVIENLKLLNKKIRDEIKIE